MMRKSLVAAPVLTVVTALLLAACSAPPPDRRAAAEEDAGIVETVEEARASATVSGDTGHDTDIIECAIPARPDLTLQPEDGAIGASWTSETVEGSCEVVQWQLSWRDIDSRTQGEKRAIFPLQVTSFEIPDLINGRKYQVRLAPVTRELADFPPDVEVAIPSTNKNVSVTGFRDAPVGETQTLTFATGCAGTRVAGLVVYADNHYEFTSFSNSPASGVALVPWTPDHAGQVELIVVMSSCLKPTVVTAGPFPLIGEKTP
jgi:hypothetical protein